MTQSKDTAPAQYIEVETVKFLMTKNQIGVKLLSERMGVSAVRRFLSGADQRHMRGDFPWLLAAALDTTVYTIFHIDHKPSLTSPLKTSQ